jgi:hypothetical protein
MRVTQAFALAVLGLVVLAFVTTGIHAWPAVVKFGPGFLTGTTWDPVSEKFGAWPFVWGTLYSSGLALLLAVPIGIGAAVFLAELSPGWLQAPVSFLVEMLAAVPSVVYGLWGVLVMVPWLRDHVETPLSDHLGDKIPLFAGAPYGVSMLSAGVVLAVMILPIITAVTRDVLRAWAARGGRPSGTPSCRSAASASSVGSCWRWEERWAKRWRLLWSSAIRRRRRSPSWSPVTAWPACSPMNSQRLRPTCTARP